MSLTYFCPFCSHETKAANICSNCRANLSGLSARSYEEKLLVALRHPEPTVPIRAATILGKLGMQSAVTPLMDLAWDSHDPYIQEPAVEALGQLGDARALPCLGFLSREGAVQVRAAAERASNTIRKNQHVGKS